MKMSLFSSLRSGSKCILCTLFLLQVFLIGVLWIYGQATEIHSTSNPSNEFPRIHFLSNTKTTQILPATPEDEDDYVLVSDSSGYNISCFKEGLSDSTLEELTTYTGQCSCRPDWHGSNCALPEVVWRAFIKAKVTVPLEPSTRPRKIVYVITGQFSNQNLLEIQINELASLVDYYILCQEGNYSFPRSTAAVKKSLTFFIQNSTCTPGLAFKRFRNEFKLEDDDIFLHSNDKEILNRKAVRFFKNFYEKGMGLVRFRLKYNVFGFFWQHDKETVVSGTLTTIVNFESGSKQKELIIGDLNHFGGWFCEFCSISSEVVHEIHVEGHTRNLHHNKNGLVDESYVQYLITNGIYVDGLTRLIKLHKSDYDKYYAPLYALKNLWKFNDLLVNVFLSFNNEADDDDDLF